VLESLVLLYKKDLKLPAAIGSRLANMRVCLISREYPPETGWGGIGTFTHHLAHGLTAQGHEVHVVSLSSSVNDAPFRGGDGEPFVHRVPSKRMAVNMGFFNFCLPVTRPMLEETTGLWLKFLQLHREKPFDVLECPEHFAEGLLPSLAGVLPLVIRLHTPHSKLVKEKFHNFQPSFDHRILTAMERVAMISADVLVSPSEDLADYVAKDLNLPLQRISIVRNPVDVHKFTPEGPVAELDNEAVKILFVGRLEQRKGVHHLIDAVPLVLKAVNGKRVQFILVGKDTRTESGHGSVLDELKVRLRETSCESSVLFIPGVPLAEMPNYYRAADICVLPSLYDNAPMTVIEAMSCGKPVVVTAAGGAKEYASNEECGLVVPPGDNQALADAIARLVNSDGMRSSFGATARQRALEKFSVEQTARETVELYESARKLFAERRASLYPGQPENLSDDLQDLIDAFERSLYEMTYSNSLRFRVKHWKQAAQARPVEFIARALGKPLSKIKNISRSGDQS
jgi:glycosyltransferase involved in cell wall biosynthesis